MPIILVCACVSIQDLKIATNRDFASNIAIIITCMIKMILLTSKVCLSDKNTL